MGSAARLEPTFIYGFSSNIKGGAHFVDDQTIVYPIGRVLAFHKIDDNTQKYIKVKGMYKINSITISPNRKVIAVAIVGPKPAISFYDTSTLKRLMTVGNPGEGFKAKMFEHLAFTQDSVYLVVVSSEPDGLLIYYKWQTGGIVAHTKADGKPSAISSTITVVAPHPSDSSVLAIGGIGVFRLMSLYYNEWRQYGFKRAEYWPISGLAWITPELVLVATRDGRMMVIEDSLMKAEFRVQDLSEIRISEKEDTRKLNVPDIDIKSDKEPGLEVRGLTSYSQGFAFAFMSGEVCVFQKVDKRHWIKKNVLATGAPSLWEELNPVVNFIKYIDISPSENVLLCSSGASEIYYASIFQEQDPKFKVKPSFQLLHNGFHYGTLSTISACLYKPLFLSVGSVDKTCRIWNFETLKLVNMMTFPDEILAAAFHPSGWYCVIAFEKELKVFMILMDSMKAVATLNVKMSNIVRYSQRGNIFACSSFNQVNVFTTTTFEKLWEFNSNNTISSFHFTANDFILFVGVMDGSVYKYCLKTGRELLQVEYESSVIHGLTSSSDGVFLHTVGTDGCLKIYRTEKSEHEAVGLVANLNLNQSVLNAVTLNCEDSVLLAAGQSNAITSIRTPVDPDEFQMSVFKLHSNPIMALEVTHVNPTLLSLGRDGVIGIWSIEGLKRKQGFLKYYREVDEVIVNAENWSNKRSIIKEQQEIMNKLDHEYDEKVKAIEAERAEQEAKISGRYQGVLDIIGLNNKITQGKNAAELEKITLRNQLLVINNDQELDGQRGSFEKRLRDEQEDLEKWRCGWNNIKYGFDGLIDAVKMSGLCIAKRLEYFAAMEITRRANETLMLKDEITQIIEEQKNRELTLIKHSQFELDELVENSERHEQLAVEIINLRNQKQKLCEQVEGLESTYFNMQEFLRESQKTIMNLDHRKSQKKQIESKQRKIQEKLHAIRESGKDILDNIDVSKSYHIHHMVSEECIEGLCQINNLLEERKNFKKKEQWLRKELANSTKVLSKYRYQLSFLSLQNYLHHNAIQKNLSREKDKSRKMHFFKTNWKKEIHTMMCSADSGNLKGRLISLCAQYADPKVDYSELLDVLPGNKEMWKAITHLEATKLHFGKCISRMKMTKQERSCDQLMKNYVKAYDDDVDWENVSDDSVDSSPSRNKSVILSKKQQKHRRNKDLGDDGSLKKKDIDFHPDVEEELSTEDEYQTSDAESSSSCGRSLNSQEKLEVTLKHLEKDKSASLKKQPLSILINRCKTANIRANMFGEFLDEKKLIANRLSDVRKRINHKKKMEKYAVRSGSPFEGGERSERATYKTVYSRIPMNSIIKALNKEVDYLSKSPDRRMLAKDLFPDWDLKEDETTPNTGHLCSLCKGFDMFTKYFEKDEVGKCMMSGESVHTPKKGSPSAYGGQNFL